jgi:hypothetical protein
VGWRARAKTHCADTPIEPIGRGAEISRRAAEKRSRPGMDDPVDSSLFEGPLTKIQKEAHLKAAETKLGVELGEVGVNELLHRLGLHDHPFVDNQIHPVGPFNQEALPFDVQVDLAKNLVPVQPQRMGQANLVEPIPVGMAVCTRQA